MRAVAAIPASALIAGAALGLLWREPRFVLVPPFAIEIVLLAWAWRTRSSLWTVVAVVATFFLGGIQLGAVAWQRAWRPPLREAFDRAADDRGEAYLTIEGTLRADAGPSNAGVALSLDVDRVMERQGFSPTSGGVLVSVVGSIGRDRIDDWTAGRRVRAPATLRRASIYLNPGVADNERALARRGTTLVGTVKSGGLVELVARGSWIDEALAATRAFSRRALVDGVGRWDAQAAAIVAAIVIGDRVGLDADVQRKLQEAGTYHVIAISGGNIAILAGLLLGGVRLAGWLGRSAMVGAIVLLVAYAMLVGGGASVDRATLMAAIYLAGRACDQRSAPLNTLAVTAGLLVAADPLSVADPAFVLTFGATLAILTVAPVGRETHENTKATNRVLYKAGFVCFVLSWFSWLISASKRSALPLFIASLATEAMLLPVGALIFSRITFAGLALNFLAIPLMAVAQVAGMLVVPLALVSRAAAEAVGWVAYLGAHGLVWSANLVRFAPAVAYRIAPPPVVAVAIYYASLAASFALRYGARGLSRARRFSRAFATVASLAAIWILADPLALVAARGDGRLHVTFIDVGQGDSSFVRFPSGTTLLVDAGGLSFSSAFDIGDRVVAPVLRGAGRYRLGYVALTHGDPDHIGGALSIVREFRPHEVWEGIPVPRSDALTTLRTATQTQGGRWANVYAGDRIVLDGVEVTARHPMPADWERQKVRNDDSLLLELRWRDVSVLFTGDIGSAVERGAVASIRPSPLRVVKVAHHGSRTSSSEMFVAAVRPQVAVVSVGRGNHFGHPAPEVIERYRAVGTEVFRTDQDGAVSVESDGSSLNVSTFTGRQLAIHETHENAKDTK